MFFYVFLSLSSFMLALLGTRLTILALRQRASGIDPLNPRKPLRGGGLAVVMALVIGLLLADVSYSIVLAVFLLAAVSLLDDLIGVAFPVRLLIQVLTVLIPIGAMHVHLFAGV